MKVYFLANTPVRQVVTEAEMEIIPRVGDEVRLSKRTCRVERVLHRPFLGERGQIDITVHYF